MAKKRIQTKDEEIARRAIDLARQVSGRLFASQDGIYVVSGMPDFRKLRHCLAGFSRPPEDSGTPTPNDLGFAPIQIAPLTTERLAAWGRGLQKWRKILNDYEKPRQKTSERRQKYRQWRKEIDHLSRVLEQLWQTFRQWESGQAVPGAPYVPQCCAATPAGGAGLARDRFAEPLWDWLERLVVWLAGPSAGRRFNDSLRPFAESRAARENRELFVHAFPRLRSLLDRRGSFSNPEMAAAVRKVLSGVPEDLRAQFGLQVPKRPHDVHIEAIVSACEIAVKGELPPAALVGSAAALCATDGAAALVPHCLLSQNSPRSLDDRAMAFTKLSDQQCEKGYESLLQVVGEMEDVSRLDLEPIRQFLVAGVESDDIQWAIRNLRCEAGNLAAKGLSPRSFRTLASVLSRAGLINPEKDLDDIAEKVAERGSMKIVDAFAQWLSSINAKAVDANLAKWALNCLSQLLVLEGLSPALRDILRRWADPPLSRYQDTPLTAGLSPEARAWLARLSYYQELCGQQPALPKSIARMLTSDDREAIELEYLRQASSRGELNESMSARLRLLQGRATTTRTGNDQRVQRQAQEVCAHIALEAVQHLASREGRRVWQKLLGCQPPRHLTHDEIGAIAAWATGLSKNALKCLRELIGGWLEEGEDYRARLSLNATWTKAVAEHIDLRKWFAPEPCEVVLEGMPVKVCVAPDPFRVLLMGSYFGTCLSLENCYKDSVLTNAYDANKAVVFALDSESKALARKLVCISSDSCLIGYRTYIAKEECLTDSRVEGIIFAIDAFCSRWANRAGLPLGSAGSPAKLSGLFWYDDGVLPWSINAARRQVDSQLDQGIRAIAEAGLRPPLLAAVNANRDKCLRMLNELGIWPPVGGEAAGDLASMPGLAEESLAVLARNEGDRELARLVFDNAMTAGGQLEAITSVALLERTDELAVRVFDFARQGPDQAARAMEILRSIGSPKAWLLLARLARLEDEAKPFWLPLAVLDSADSAGALWDVMAGPEKCEVDYRYLLLACELLSACGRSLPQMAIIKALLPEYGDPCMRCCLSQWLPPLPEGLNRSLLEKIAQPPPYWGDEERYAQLAAVMMAMHNPGASSTAYLKKTSENYPPALLALSLQHGERFKGFVRKRALSMPAEPAAFLALFVSEGDDAATRLLAGTIGSDPKQEKRLNEARELHAAFCDLNHGRLTLALSGSDRIADVLSVLPYVTHWLRRWTDLAQPNVAAIGALMGSGRAKAFVRTHCVDSFGLAARMARLLRTADGNDEFILRESLLELLDHGSIAMENEYASLFDKLSGGRLWPGAVPSNHKPLPMRDAASCAGIWELLVDEAGKPRQAFSKIDLDTLWDIRFPMDPRMAARLAKLLPSYIRADRLVECIRPATEMHRRLIMHHIQPVGG